MRSRAGFTLIEILVVLFIVSLLTGLVVANLPSFVTTADYEEEGRRLKFALEQGLEKAQIEAVEVGVRADETGYEFWVFDEATQDWLPSIDRALVAHRIADGLGLRLTTEGEPIELKRSDPEAQSDTTSESQQEITGPKVLLLSSGETTVFEIALVSEAGFWMSVSSDGFGTFEIKREPQARDE